MNVGLLYTKHPFTEELLRNVRAKLPNEQFIEWQRGEAAPSEEIEVLLLEGRLTRAEMEALPRLKLIQTLSAGYEGVDEDAATELGIWLSYAPSQSTGNAASVAELAVFLMIGAARHAREAMRSVYDGAAEVPRNNVSLQGKTVLIAGLGGIGRMLAERLQPFGMRILATEDNAGDALPGVQVYPTDQLAEVMGGADFVVLCMRADKTNEDFIDAKMLDAMKKGGILINVARGSLINEEALCAAVKSGHITAAGLDVLKVEPADPGNPLLTLHAVLITPHIAGLTDLMLEGTAEYVAIVVREFAAGRKMTSYVNLPQRPRQVLAEASSKSA